MWRSLRLRLLVATILVALVAVGVTALVARYRTTGEFQRYVEHGGSLRYARFGGFLAGFYDLHNSWEGVQPEIEQMGQISGQRLLLADGEGWIIADSERNLMG